ncbi:unnamed protein product [Cylicocyclus nassatus]|uniref:Uncharacterized protein n=1 Tax=Cylicocyclus nassatus TaxID=53992 RepID=A0AA36DQT9_CYLNA|nr:unnamed protein product [Cylicocyclus nassatus]
MVETREQLLCLVEFNVEDFYALARAERKHERRRSLQGGYVSERDVEESDDGIEISKTKTGDRSIESVPSHCRYAFVQRKRSYSSVNWRAVMQTTGAGPAPSRIQPQYKSRAQLRLEKKKKHLTTT